MRILKTIFASLAMIALGQAWGFGLNKIYGIQTIGSPFYAEIPIQSAPTVSRQCVTVKPLPGEKETFISDLQADVAGPPNAQRLVISSRSPVRGPLVNFVVAVNCPEASMTREYTVLADGPAVKLQAKRESAAPSAVPPVSSPPPVATATAVSPPSVPATAGGTSGSTLVVPVATTLNAMARVLYPHDRPARDAYRAAFAAANPSLFGGIKSVGSVLLPAGTVLQVPPTMPTPSTIPAVEPPTLRSTAPMSSATRPSFRAPGPRAGGTDLSRGQGDRLMVGVATPQLKMLADAITRIEAMAAERDKVQSELVGGVSGSLNAVIELKNRLAAQEVQMRQLIELQIESERRRAKDKESEIGLIGLLVLMISAMALAAGLVFLHHFLATRRQALLLAQAPRMPIAEPAKVEIPAAAVSPPSPAAPSGVPAVRPVPPAMAPVPPPPVVERPPAPEPEPQQPPPVKLEPPPVMEYVPEVPKVDTSAPAQTGAAHGALEPGYPQIEFTTAAASPPALPDLPEASPVEASAPEAEYLLPSLLDKEITELTVLLRQSDDADPAHCLRLLQQARATGLMTSQESQALLTEFRRVFNADVMHENDTRTLEAFPRVLGSISKTWDGPDGVQFLTSLIYDDRGGEREGFPERAYEEILLLRDVLTTRIAMQSDEEPAPSADEPPPFSIDFILPEAASK